ncbi:MAG: prephenate dehydratase [Candidatus Neomarinimicrobiota bacterium]|nr:MAG: prephenate dehydratase [Candidatus Neomarinimicrobiota bacterium]
MIHIGIQGAKGSFSEEAAWVFARNHGLEPVTLDYLISSEAVLAAVEQATVDYGIFAMENAQGGVVIESVAALAHHRCEIVEMFHIDVRQNLLALPGVFLGDITEIYSHQQALRQCKEYLAEHFWARPLIETEDTARAAEDLRNGTLPRTAAVIASRTCAELYDLNVVAEDIHDLKHNLTLFLGVKPWKQA